MLLLVNNLHEKNITERQGRLNVRFGAIKWVRMCVRTCVYVYEQVRTSVRVHVCSCVLIAAVGSFILGNDRWSLVRSFDPSFASGNSQWKNLLYDALWPISSRVIRNWHVLAQQKIVLAQRKIACARSQLELSFLVDRSQDLRLFPTAALTSQWELLVYVVRVGTVLLEWAW